MHPMYEKANKALEDAVIAMQTVLDTLGVGLLESIYQKCLAHELELMGHRVITEKQVEVNYKFVDNSVVVDVSGMGVAVDGKFAQTFKPFRSKLVVGEKAQCCCEHVGFPSVLFCFRVACIACWNAAVKFVVAFCFQKGIDVSFLFFAEFVPLEVGGISYRHGPE